ncbi:MAG: hypothetical protein ABIC04_01430 [Nanoarchaeota archaeon]
MVRADVPLLNFFYDKMDRESIYRRYRNQRPGGKINGAVGLDISALDKNHNLHLSILAVDGSDTIAGKADYAIIGGDNLLEYTKFINSSKIFKDKAQDIKIADIAYLVLSEYRGLKYGISDALVCELMKHAKENGFDYLSAMIDFNNGAARKLLKRVVDNCSLDIQMDSVMDLPDIIYFVRL